MPEHDRTPRPRPAKARSQASEYARRTELDLIRSSLDECCHTLDLQFQRMAQMQAEIERLKADVERTSGYSSLPPRSEPPAE